MSKLITLTDLNDDCLVEIVEYLDLADQLSLWQTTETQSRLSSIICLTWQRVLAHSLNYATFETCEAILDEFVECIEDTVNVLQLIDIPARILEQWITRYNLSQVQSLACALSEKQGDNDSEYISKLQQLFPLVSCLQLRGNFNCLGIAKWKHLIQLDLAQCEYIQKEEFQSICEQLKIQQIRVGKINSKQVEQLIKLAELKELEFGNLSKDSLTTLFCLPKLTKLGFGDKIAYYAMRTTISVLGRDIVGITFHNSIAANSVFQLLWLKTTIKKLTLINEYNWDDLDKTRIIYDLPFIEQLHVVQTPIWDTAEELWDMIATCPRLEVLYISGQRTDKWFFTWDRELMHYILKTRARPLSLYFHHLEPHKELIRHYFQHANLKLSFEAVAIEYIRNKYTKVEFLPKESSKLR